MISHICLFSSSSSPLLSPFHSSFSLLSSSLLLFPPLFSQRRIRKRSSGCVHFSFTLLKCSMTIYLTFFLLNCGSNSIRICGLSPVFCGFKPIIICGFDPHHLTLTLTLALILTLVLLRELGFIQRFYFVYPSYISL